MSADAVPADAVPADAVPAGASREIWVVAEEYRTGLHPVSGEGIAAAARVAPRLDAAVVAVLLCAEPGDLAADLAACGAHRVLLVRDADLDPYAPERHAGVVADLMRRRAPLAVVGPWTVRGRDYLPRVAARLSLGMTGDVVGLDVDPHPGDASVLDLVWLKPAWAGTALARVVARTVPSLGTLRPGAVAALPRRPGRRIPVEEVTAYAPPARLARRVGVADGGGCGLLDAATVLVVVGSGLDGTAVAELTRVATDNGWSIAGTPGAVAAGRLSPACELSVRKRSLSPRVVVGLGLTGSADLEAVRGAGTVVTVDPDPHAEIHSVADVAGVLSGAAFIEAAVAGPVALRA
jgi:electron transfer flavoprotein alpha subunit